MVELGTKTAACKHGNDSFNLFRTHSVHLQVLQLMQGTHFCVPQLMAAAPRLSSLWILSFCTDHPLLIHASTPIAASTPISWLHDFYFHSYTKEAKITFQTLTLNFTSWFLFWNFYLTFHILYLHIQQVLNAHWGGMQGFQDLRGPRCPLREQDPALGLVSGTYVQNW